MLQEVGKLGSGKIEPAELTTRKAALVGEFAQHIVAADAVQHGGGSKLIATHPDPVERLANVQAWIGTAWDADYADRIVSTREF